MNLRDEQIQICTFCVDGKMCLLMFDVCGGYTNQILSISFATTVAVQLRADYIVLPSLYMKGVQTRRNSLYDKKMDFGALFDLFHFSSILFQHFSIIAVTDVPTAIKKDFSSSIKVMCASQESLAKCFLKVKNQGNKNNSQQTTGEVYSTYSKLCNSYNLDELTQRRIGHIISELDMQGLINAKVVNLGRHGRTKYIDLAVEKEQLLNIIKDDHFLSDLIESMTKQQIFTKSMQSRLI